MKKEITIEEVANSLTLNTLETFNRFVTGEKKLLGESLIQTCIKLNKYMLLISTTEDEAEKYAYVQKALAYDVEAIYLLNTLVADKLYKAKKLRRHFDSANKVKAYLLDQKNQLSESSKKVEEVAVASAVELPDGFNEDYDMSLLQNH